MRIFLAAVFALVGAPLVATALGTLAAGPPIDQRTFAMMQVIAGLLCILIAVVAAFMRPGERTELAPQPAAPKPAPPPAAASVRDRLGIAILVLCLTLVLIVLGTWLRTPDRVQDAGAHAPVPVSGSEPPPRSLVPAVTPLGGTAEARKASAKTHSSPRTRSARDDD
jgi:hypothetical protein